MKKWNRVLAAAMAAVMAAGLTACGGGKAPETTAAATEAAKAETEAQAAEETTAAPAAAEGLAVNTTDPIEITFSWWGGDSRHEATLKAVDAFMEKYPNITVKSSYSAWDGWEDKMSSQFATGTAPDVNQINWNWITSFSSDGSAFYDLNKLSDILDLTQFSQGYLDQCTVAAVSYTHL